MIRVALGKPTNGFGGFGQNGFGGAEFPLLDVLGAVPMYIGSGPIRDSWWHSPAVFPWLADCFVQFVSLPCRSVAPLAARVRRVEAF